MVCNKYSKILCVQRFYSQTDSESHSNNGHRLCFDREEISKSPRLPLQASRLNLAALEGRNLSASPAFLADGSPVPGPGSGLVAAPYSLWEAEKWCIPLCRQGWCWNMRESSRDAGEGGRLPPLIRENPAGQGKGLQRVLAHRRQGGWECPQSGAAPRSSGQAACGCPSGALWWDCPAGTGAGCRRPRVPVIQRGGQRKGVTEMSLNPGAGTLRSERKARRQRGRFETSVSCVHVKATAHGGSLAFPFGHQRAPG